MYIYIYAHKHSHVFTHLKLYTCICAHTNALLHTPLQNTTWHIMTLTYTTYKLLSFCAHWYMQEQIMTMEDRNEAWLELIIWNEWNCLKQIQESSPLSIHFLVSLHCRQVAICWFTSRLHQGVLTTAPNRCWPQAKFFDDFLAERFEISPFEPRCV